MTDTEVERIAYLMREAHHEVATAWLDTLTDSPPTPSECWAAVARAVIADREAQEPVPQDAPNKQRAWLIERLREEDAKLRAINLRLAQDADAARAKLGAVNARLYEVEAERDAAIAWIRTVGDDLQVAGDRDVILAAVRRLRDERDAARGDHLAEEPQP